MCIRDRFIAWHKLSKLWCKGSTPVITKKAAPFFRAFLISSVISLIAIKGYFSLSHEYLVSHHEHPTLQPASLIKKALWPVWKPSPCNELKIIINDQKDIDFAIDIKQEIINKYQNLSSKRDFDKLDKKYYLQPAWENVKGFSLTIDFVKNNPEWNLSLQTHKYLNIK